jgi:hypothetical protein
MKPFNRFVKSNGLNPADPVPAADEFLNEAVREWFPDAPLENVNNFTVENLSEAAIKHFKSNPAVSGATTPLYVKRDGVIVSNGRSNVYFNKNIAFSSAKQLYKTIGHELIHVNQFSLLAGQTPATINSLRNLMEFQPYNGQPLFGATNIGNSFTREEITGFLKNPWYEKLAPINYKWIYNHNIPK